MTPERELILRHPLHWMAYCWQSAAELWHEIDHLRAADQINGIALAELNAELGAVRAEVERYKQEILAAGKLDFDWSVLKRLDRLETAEQQNAELRAGLERALKLCHSCRGEQMRYYGLSSMPEMCRDCGTLHALLAASAPPIEVHLNTRGCEPMQPGTAEALGRAFKLMREQLSKPDASAPGGESLDELEFPPPIVGPSVKAKVTGAETSKVYPVDDEDAPGGEGK